MEESIKILEKMIESAEKSINKLEDNDLSDTIRGVLELRKQQTQSLLNLINKYKEQEEQIEEYKLNVKEAMHEAQENARIFRKEQAKTNEYRKMVELMAEYIDFDKMNFNCSSLCVKEGCREECIIDYFRKKAKGE